MIEVKKIKEKIELKDMDVNVDYNPCYFYWNEQHKTGRQDCETDCTACGYDKKGRKIKRCPFGTDRY